MTEIAAAMGLVSLESLDRFVATNKRNYDQYAAALRGAPGVRLIAYDEKERNNFQYIILEIDEQLTRISRDDIIRVLHAENILSRRYFYPGCHRMEPYHSFFPHAGLLLPHTERLASRVLTVPTGTAVGKKEVGPICQLLKFCVEYGGEISTRLQALPPSC
jgi:dTDP-4-amino-4,6-dideoxygalactose transaminase